MSAKVLKFAKLIFLLCKAKNGNPSRKVEKGRELRESNSKTVTFIIVSV